MVWHVGCVTKGVAGLFPGPEWVKPPIQSSSRDWGSLGRASLTPGVRMSWTKPEFEVVEVTMEVTAYVARR